MKKFQLNLTVTSIDRLNDRYVLIKLTKLTQLPDMCAGQFIEIKIEGSPTTFLRRPISICFVDKEKNELWLLVATVGDGTRQMTKLKPGDLLNCILPLGNEFSIPNNNKAKPLLIGGGVGVAPLLFLGKSLKEEHNITPTFLLGARSKNDLLLISEFEKYGLVLITTEDGSEGEQGYVTGHSVLRNKNFDFIYTCGPKPMMVSVAKYAKKMEIDCEASLENTMACGIGACLCCVEKTVKGNLCVCSDGPVFNTKQLLWLD